MSEAVQPVMSQPVAAGNITNVVINQPQQSADKGLLLVDLKGHRTWSTGLFECFEDLSTTVLVFCCMPIMECRLAYRLGECCTLPYSNPGGMLAIRTKIRTMGGIKGSIGNDSTMINCCGPCALAQMYRELDAMGL